ncbi:hypothetical protein TNCV_4274071 [Trichonephila clavipes]|nr:hypothetical protein TNCV_4274071 [Trichonephila clavipes]
MEEKLFNREYAFLKKPGRTFEECTHLHVWLGARGFKYIPADPHLGRRVTPSARKAFSPAAVQSSGAAALFRQVGSSVTTSGDRKFSLRSQEANLIRNKAGKRCITSVNDRRTKIQGLQDKRVSRAAISSDLSDASVSVSTKTSRRR